MTFDAEKFDVENRLLAMDIDPMCKCNIEDGYICPACVAENQMREAWNGGRVDSLAAQASVRREALEGLIEHPNVDSGNRRYLHTLSEAAMFLRIKSPSPHGYGLASELEQLAERIERALARPSEGQRPEAEDEPDITKCPNCGGPADNGFDRCLPPSPYNCTKCDSLLDGGQRGEEEA